MISNNCIECNGLLLDYCITADSACMTKSNLARWQVVGSSKISQIRLIKLVHSELYVADCRVIITAVGMLGQIWR